MGKRTRYAVDFKARVAMDALRGELMLAELSAKHGAHPNLISQWKRLAAENMASVFVGGGAALDAKIGELVVERDSSAAASGRLLGNGVPRTEANAREQDAFAARRAKLSVRRECTLLSLTRSTLFTSDEFRSRLRDAEIRISMDGKGRWIDNRFVERLWRSLKYEGVYLNAFETGSETRNGIGAWITYCNEKRPHSSHGLMTPAEAYDPQRTNLKIAA